MVPSFIVMSGRLRLFRTLALLSLVACHDQGDRRPRVGQPQDVLGGVQTASTADSDAIRLLDPGAEPKTMLAYNFAGTARTVDATIETSQVGGGEALPWAANAVFHFTFSATPKPPGPGGRKATIDFRVLALRIELRAPAPDDETEARALEKSFTGVEGHFDLSSQAEISNPVYEVEAVSSATDPMSRALEMLVVPLPREAVGLGARWIRRATREEGDTTGLTGSATMTLLARDTSTATIGIEAQNSGTLHSTDDPRVPADLFVHRVAKTRGTTVIAFDGVARRADGETRLDVVGRAKGQPDMTFQMKTAKRLSSH